MEIKEYKKIGLYRKPKKQILNLLKDNEEVLINLRVFPFRSIFRNNVRERYAKCLVLTTERIFFINRGWVIKEIISFAEITDVLVTRKWLISGDLPVIVIKTVNDSYEIFFSTIISFRRKIEIIIDCIKKRNPKINIEIDPKYKENFFKEILFTKIKFK